MNAHLPNVSRLPFIKRNVQLCYLISLILPSEHWDCTGHMIVKCVIVLIVGCGVSGLTLCGAAWANQTLEWPLLCGEIHVIGTCCSRQTFNYWNANIKRERLLWITHQGKQKLLGDTIITLTKTYKYIFLK